MPIRRLLFLTGLFIVTTHLSAQKIKIAQAIGLYAGQANISGYARGIKDSVLTDCNFHLQMRQFGIVYTIRAEVFQWKRGSVSIGSPVMLGYSFTGNYNSTDFNGTTTRYTDSVKGGHIAFEIPVVADVNIGLHNAADEKGSLGFYVGAGYSYSYTKLRSSIGKIPFDGFDPLIRAGIRMGKSWETRWGLGFSMKGMRNGTRTYGIQLLKEL